jgi:adenylate cyclase
MEAPPVERRLVAILAADVEGYSRLMHGDEEATMATLSARRAVVDDLIGQHRGRIANTAGDSVLAEFISVLDAVHCAVDIQTALQSENDGEPEGRQMRFRIGVNVGDVMAKEGDIFGDGVNVAARLEGLVKGGEICVSRGVRDHLRHRGGLIFEDLGEQLVKNIAHPIRAFRLRIGDGPSEPEAPNFEQDPEPTELPAARAATSELSADNEVALELALWDSVKDGSPAELESYLEQYPEGPSPRSPKHDLKQRRFRQRPGRRQPRKSPLMLSILPSGIPSRTATGARSWKPTSSNIRTGISPGSHARVWA